MDSKTQIVEQRHQFDMNTGWDYYRNHLQRGEGKMFSYLWNRFQWNYWHRMNMVPSFPLNVHIESSSQCNIKCDHCFRQYMDMKEDENMPMDMLMLSLGYKYSQQIHSNQFSRPLGFLEGNKWLV